MTTLNQSDRLPKMGDEAAQEFHGLRVEPPDCKSQEEI